MRPNWSKDLMHSILDSISALRIWANDSSLSQFYFESGMRHLCLREGAMLMTELSKHVIFPSTGSWIKKILSSGKSIWSLFFMWFFTWVLVFTEGILVEIKMDSEVKLKSYIKMSISLIVSMNNAPLAPLSVCQSRMVTTLMLLALCPIVYKNWDLAMSY